MLREENVGYHFFSCVGSSAYFLGLLSQESLRDEQRVLAGSGHRYQDPDPVTPHTPYTHALDNERASSTASSLAQETVRAEGLSVPGSP